MVGWVVGYFFECFVGGGRVAVLCVFFVAAFATAQWYVLVWRRG